MSSDPKRQVPMNQIDVALEQHGKACRFGERRRQGILVPADTLCHRYLLFLGLDLVPGQTRIFHGGGRVVREVVLALPPCSKAVGGPSQGPGPLRCLEVGIPAPNVRAQPRATHSGIVGVQQRRLRLRLGASYRADGIGVVRVKKEKLFACSADKGKGATTLKLDPPSVVASYTWAPAQHAWGTGRNFSW